MKLPSVTITLSCLCLTAVLADAKAQGRAATIPTESIGKVTVAAQLPIEKSSWGTLQWIWSEKLMPGATQTVGLAMILPGKRNPVHFHPNCETT